jgi:glycosyltransferase involved in cell wall biosynthesis
MSHAEGSERLRVMFDARWWVSGPISNRSVQRELILAWLESFDDDDVLLAVPAAQAAEASAEVGGRATVVPTRVSPHGVSVIAELPLLGRRHQADVLITHNFTPAAGRSATFVHDFLFLSNPEWFTAKERAYFALMPLSIRRAGTVFTSSASEARRVARYGRLSSEPVPVGLALGTASEAPSIPVQELASTSRFLLTVGRLNARKNLQMVISAALASGAVTPHSPLVVVGEKSGKAEDLLPEASAAVESGALRFLGRVSDGELNWLYEQTALFLFLTLDEGFGLPTIEALRAGAPQLVSDIPVFREILGENAAYVDPRDRERVTDAIGRAVAAPPPAPTRDSVLARYSWLRSATTMREAIMHTAGAAGSRR